jgi:16S rRNA (guanine966-N2)-methyltransferase
VSDLRIIGGSAKGQRLLVPTSARPTGARVRKSLFDILEINFGAGSTLLDVCAGAGGVGLEAASRGYEVTMLERDSRAIQTLERNKRELRLEAKITKTDALKFLAATQGRWEIVFIDPPFQHDLTEYAQLALRQNLLEAGGVLIVQHPDKLRLLEHSGYTLERREYGSNALTLYWLE